MKPLQHSHHNLGRWLVEKHDGEYCVVYDSKSTFKRGFAIGVVCLLLAGCMHKTDTVVDETTHRSLPPRLLALLESPPHDSKNEKERPAMPEGGLSDATVDQFRKRIAALQFPLPANTVLQLFPYDLLWSGRLDGDAFGDPNGYLGGTLTWYSLSPKYVLYLKQSHYSSKQRMVTVDDEAEIMTQEEAGRRWPSEEEKNAAKQMPSPTSGLIPGRGSP